MLAKMWKKVLLVICIIACIWNITSKIMNRHSLEENLNSANDGKKIFEITRKTDDLTIKESITEVFKVLDNSNKTTNENTTNQTQSVENTQTNQITNTNNNEISVNEVIIN